MNLFSLIILSYFNSFIGQLDYTNNSDFLLDSNMGVTSYVFMAVECPISQKYIYRLNELQQLYPNLNVIGVFQESTSQLALDDFKQRFEVKFSCVFDKQHQLAFRYHAEVTPEVFLVDSLDRIIYSGAIDNWFVSLGRNRGVPSQHYLLDAYQSFLKGIPVQKFRTKAIGCFLEINPTHHHG